MTKLMLPDVNVTIKCGLTGCKIHPSVILVERDQSIVFNKAMPGTVHVQISQIGRPFKFKAHKHEVKIPRTAPVGIYPYAVFCYGKKAFCTGSSMPIIIVPR